MGTYGGPGFDQDTADDASAFGMPYWATGAGGALLLVAAALSTPSAPTDRINFTDLLALVTATLCTLTGFLQLERWRVTGSSTALWTAAGGFVAAAMVAARRVLPASDVGIAPDTIGALALACTVVLAVVVACVALGPELQHRIRPAHIALLVIGMLVVLHPTLQTLDLGLRTRTDPTPGSTGRLVIAGAWLLAGTLLTRRARRSASVTHAWLGLFTFALAGAEAVGALQIGQGVTSNPMRFAVVALGALGVTYASEADLRSSIARQASELDDTRARYSAVDHRARDAQAAAAERAHEARNALAAIDGAIRTLEKYQDRLAADTKAQLSAGMAHEIVRLQRLVDVDEKLEPPTVFRVSEVLTPVVMLARTQGLEVESDLRPDVEALASRDATIEAVQNLLINAQRHAAGHGVVLQLGTDGERAIIRVLDRGPGVPAEHREAIFERGRPGGETGGRGFGLYLSRRLVEAQGGSLTVSDRQGGGARFELVLPLAPSCRRMWAPPVDAPEDIGHAEESGRP
jgi:signal transduction histidine kinase